VKVAKLKAMETQKNVEIKEAKIKGSENYEIFSINGYFND